MFIEDKLRETIMKINGGGQITLPRILALLAESATELSNIRSELQRRTQLENNENN